MKQRVVPVDGCRLNVLEEGAGLPVVFVHGVVTTSQLAAANLAAFAPKFRGIAVDLRGYGESEKPGWGYNIDQFAADLNRLAEQMGFDRAVWLGVSMGGMILQRFCLEYPARVAAAILVSTTDQAMVLDHDIPSIGAGRDYRAVSGGIIDASFPSGADPSWPKKLRERIPTWNAEVLREALGSMARFNVRGKLSGITAPTLVLAGSEDDVATPEIARQIQAQIPGAKCVIFEKAGHFMMMEQPERYRAVLREFLDGLRIGDVPQWKS